MNNTNIEWTDLSWNPFSGCKKVSPGCKNCYAETIADKRFGGQAAYPNGFDLTLRPEKLGEITPRQAGKKIFVNSMSDLFLEEVPTDYLRSVCDVMMSAPQHRFQILTKRHERMKELLSSPMFRDVAMASHIWWGVSAEDRKYGLPRIETLKAAPVKNRFISFEPLLEDMGDVDLDGIGWIIIGGESGPGARPFHLEWAESLLEQGRRDRVPVFVKQLGAHPYYEGEPFDKAAKDPKGHQMFAWPIHLQVREFPASMHVVPDLVKIAPAPKLNNVTPFRVISKPAPEDDFEQGFLPEPPLPGEEPVNLHITELARVQDWLTRISNVEPSHSALGCIAAAARSSLAGLMLYMFPPDADEKIS